MGDWTCPHCWHPEELHLHLGQDPATGAVRLGCLFDVRGAPLTDRDVWFREFASKAVRIVDQRDRAVTILAEVLQSGLSELRSLARDVLAIEADLEKALIEEAARCQKLRAECDRLRPAAERHDAVVLLMQALENRIAELEAARVDYGTCVACGKKATQCVVSELGTLGACGNAEHMMRAFKEYSLRPNNTRPPSLAEKA